MAETESKAKKTTRLDELAEKFKTPQGQEGALSPEEKGEFVKLFGDAKDTEGFSITAFADGHGYDRKCYDRLHRLSIKEKTARRKGKTGKSKKRKKGTTETRELSKAEKLDRAKFIKDRWEEQRSIGEEAILGYTQKASERGMKITDYVRVALAFYDVHGDRVTVIVEENEQLNAMNEILKEAIKPEFRRQACLRIFQDFVITVYQLRAMDVIVPQEAIEDVRQKLMMAMGGNTGR